MSQAKSSDIVFFFGAGASAPFGIPTMKQFVTDFEVYLNESASKDERLVYDDIKRTLEERTDQGVDLEAIFSVIDGVLNYSPERLGVLSLYSAVEFKRGFPNKLDLDICRNLKKKFESFVREKCAIPDGSYGHIRMVYRDFFNRIALELKNGVAKKKECAWRDDWVIFTTNYDTSLEYYWREFANAGVSTGFVHNKIRKLDVLNSSSLLQDGIGDIQLLKLHGSVSWLLLEGTDEVIEVMERGDSYVGRKYKGEIMLYPIAEKELYLDPYISMLLRLNRELEKKSIWLVIGYSFNDPVIREIFLNKSTQSKHLILVHPKASEVHRRKLKGIEGKISLIEKKFGLEKDRIDGEKEEMYQKVNHQIIHKLKDQPKFEWHSYVVP